MTWQTGSSCSTAVGDAMRSGRHIHEARAPVAGPETASRQGGAHRSVCLGVVRDAEGLHATHGAPGPAGTGPSGGPVKGICALCGKDHRLRSRPPPGPAWRGPHTTAAPAGAAGAPQTARARGGAEDAAPPHREAHRAEVGADGILSERGDVLPLPALIVGVVCLPLGPR